MDEILENTEIEMEIENSESPSQTYTQEDLIVNITERYLELVNNVKERYKYHPELSSSIEAGLRKFHEKMERNHDQVLYTLSDNFLYCLEAVKDMNCDFFIYQTDRIKKKNGKVEKLEISKLIGRASMRTLLRECDERMSRYVFSTLIEIFKSLTYKNEDDEYVFYDFYIHFVKENLHQSRNYSKMLVSIDNVKYILDETIEPISYDEANVESSSESDNDSEKGKKKKKSKSKEKNGFEDMFMKGLEKTKIAKLAKNISEKLSNDDSSPLNNPMKLLSSLTGNGNSDDGDGGLGNLLKTIVGEVQTAMTQEGMDERELMGEAMNMMGTFKNLAGFDPMSIMKNMMGKEGGVGGEGESNTGGETDEDVMRMFGITPENMNERTLPQNPDMAQLSGIFGNLNRTLGREMRKIVEEQNQSTESVSQSLETQTETTSSIEVTENQSVVEEQQTQSLEEPVVENKRKSKKKKE